jgi:hypothetical protein
MSSEQTRGTGGRVDLQDPPPVGGNGTPGDPSRELDWWHREHPTFTALTGFFSGLVLVTVLPGTFVAMVRAAFGERVAGEAFPFVLMLLAVPIALLAFPRTRRFGKYLVLGMVVTLFVVIGVGSLVFFLMLRYS